MNIKLILFSGVFTALIGTVIGLGVAKIGQRDFSQLKFESQSYQNLYRSYALIGAGVGFAVGIGQECVRELKAQQDSQER
jgi:hypothetical protein